MADPINFANIIWQILGILPKHANLIAKYPSFQDQLIYLIFIPHIVFLFFIVMFATMVSLGHKGFRNLMGIGAYIFLIYSGWYAQVLPFLLAWWQITLAVAFFGFLISSVFKAGKAGELMGVGRAIGAKVVGNVMEKKQAEKKVEEIDEQIKSLGIQRGRIGSDPAQAQALNFIMMQISELEREKATLKKRYKL